MEQWQIKRRVKRTGDVWIGATRWTDRTAAEGMVVQLDDMIRTIEHSVVPAQPWCDDV